MSTGLFHDARTQNGTILKQIKLHTHPEHSRSGKMETMKEKRIIYGQASHTTTNDDSSEMPDKRNADFYPMPEKLR